MDNEPLPNRRVIEEGRTCLKAAEILRKLAFNGNIALAWPAATKAGSYSSVGLLGSNFTWNAFKKSSSAKPAFDPEGYLLLSKAARRHGHDLLALYQAIPGDLSDRLREISERLKPGFPLEASIKDCSQLFVGTRYTYEAKSLSSFYSEVFELGPHLDQVLEEMIRKPVTGTPPVL